MPYFDCVSHQIYYEQQGQGDAVLYIHGGFPSLRMAMHTLKPYDWRWENDFAAQVNFIWHDRRGCYRSSRSSDGYSLTSQAHDIIALMDHLNLTRVHLIGSSAGGPIGIIFAATYPARVKSLTLTGTGLDLFPSDDDFTPIIRQQLDYLDTNGAAFAYDNRPAGIETTLDDLWSKAEAQQRGELDKFLRVQSKMAEKAQSIPRAERIAWYQNELESLRAYMTDDLNPYVARVNCPVLIIHGRDDQSVPLVWAKKMHAQLPDSQFEVVDGGAHSLMIRDATVRQRTIDFINSHA